jgi:acetyl-CoA C-acetyltransferase
MRRVAIVGVGQTGFSGRREETHAELSKDAFVRALADCSLDASDIDAFVHSQGPEAFIGIAAPERVSADDLGAAGKPLMRINTGGATGTSAVLAAIAHVASGSFECVAVVGADKIKECGAPQTILNKIWDPLYEEPLWLNTISMCALVAQSRMTKYGDTEEVMAYVSAMVHNNALRNVNAHFKKSMTLEDVMASPYLCWPVKLAETCPSSEGGCALIVASEEVANRLSGPKAWIAGVGSSSNDYFMGDRIADDQFARWEALTTASRRAYAMAGISSPREEIDVVEAYDAFSCLPLLELEALGLSPEGGARADIEAGLYDVNGRIPLNPSGGTLCTNPISVAALLRVAEAALQTMGRAGDHQVDRVRAAAVTGVGGSVQFHNALVLTQTPA